MDANAPISSNAMQHITNDMKHRYLMDDFLPEICPQTYQRGHDKIDYCLGTSGILHTM